MKTLATLFASIALFAGTAFADFPEGSPSFKTDYDAALKAAKEGDKPVIVVFSATWCPPCQANKKNVYPADAVKPYHEKFVWAYLDTDVEKNANVAKKFGVSGIPHIQFVSKDGETIDKKVGGTSPKSFAKTLKKVLKKAEG